MQGIRTPSHNNQEAIMSIESQNAKPENTSPGELLPIQGIRMARHHKNGKVSKSKSFIKYKDLYRSITPLYFIFVYGILVGIFPEIKRHTLWRVVSGRMHIC